MDFNVFILNLISRPGPYGRCLVRLLTIPIDHQIDKNNFWFSVKVKDLATDWFWGWNCLGGAILFTYLYLYYKNWNLKYGVKPLANFQLNLVFVQIIWNFWICSFFNIIFLEHLHLSTNTSLVANSTLLIYNSLFDLAQL